jgi:hypothetical protein
MPRHAHIIAHLAEGDVLCSSTARRLNWTHCVRHRRDNPRRGDDGGCAGGWREALAGGVASRTRSITLQDDSSLECCVDHSHAAIKAVPPRARKLSPGVRKGCELLLVVGVESWRVYRLGSDASTGPASASSTTGMTFKFSKSPHCAHH